MIYPTGVQSLQVAPNELEKESEYIARNIRMTRAAYALDGITETNFPARPGLSAAQVDANAEKLANACKRGEANIEDQLRSALALVAGAHVTHLDLTPIAGREFAIFAALAIGPMLLGHTGMNWALKFMPAYVVNLVTLGAVTLRRRR